MVDYDWEPIKPVGFAASMLGVTIMFTAICLPIFVVRIWIRISYGPYLLAEDYLMSVGVFLNMIHNGIVLWSVFAGVGTPDSKLSPGEDDSGSENSLPISLLLLLLLLLDKVSGQLTAATVFWQIFYVTSSLMIKTSIAVQISRIATQRLYKIFLYILIAMTAAATLIGMVVVLARCRPVSASWTGDGKCLDQSLIIALTYVVASIATIVRLPYSSAYSAKHNSLCQSKNKVLPLPEPLRLHREVESANSREVGIGHIIIWTVVECSLGIIAGCLPMLRRLFKDFSTDHSHNKGGYTRQGEINELATVGKLSSGKNRNAAVEVTVYTKGENDGSAQGAGSDAGSTNHIIRVTRSVRQTSASIDR
ncbi:LOW QUALITY PROTEIN: hypothetical protein GMORB2_1410 [Geosmithia morbida]|uniref:Rhodopsin domain-containing protein n=1 Tax=Geosmithia morbida TaxID=1094350 RepID=A0A9P4Z3X4_9HYPO|nr:LOW QUALITY PROTEIN: uncharacterized protein GMORB2_1410 [Geosmithia morbida]KAF4126164.1 LOW QUALITY PROTEIN: hypothetical protein GMORB2_1410 [Geosmithia morbida]